MGLLESVSLDATGLDECDDEEFEEMTDDYADEETTPMTSSLVDTQTNQEDDDDIEVRSEPVQLAEQYAGQIQAYTENLSKPGAKVHVYFKRLGWFEGVVQEHDDLSYGQRVLFDEGWTDCKLSKRAYGINGTWVAPLIPQSVDS
jgi:hypothetical protein